MCYLQLGHNIYNGISKFTKGKSTLASRIIEALNEEEENPVLFFYCSDHQEDKHTFIHILRGLIAQLLSKDPALAAFFCEKYTGYDGKRFGSASVIKDAADIAFSSQRIIYVVLDGLDECDSCEAEKTLSWFLSRQKKTLPGTDGHIRLLCIGQRTDLLERMLSSAHKISMDNQRCHKEDIELYITSMARRISDNMNLSADIQERIIAKVSNVANGMHLD